MELIVTVLVAIVMLGIMIAIELKKINDEINNWEKKDHD
jgi:uncharacterized protein YoxC